MKKTGAFTLVEVALALGIAAFCLVTIFALLPVGQAATAAALNQTGANAILSVIAADLRGTPKGSSQQSAQFQITIPQAQPVTIYFDGAGNFTNTLDANSHYRATVTFIPTSPGGPSATMAHLRVSWPAPASAANASGKVDSLVAMDRN